MKKLITAALVLICISLTAQVQKRALSSIPATSTKVIASPSSHNSIRSVSDIKTLRTITGAVNEVIYVKYHTVDYDNGGGFFIWRTSAELINGNGYFTRDNNGTIIKATASNTGRWIRQYDGYINLAFFGGYLTDATTALQAALDFEGQYGFYTAGQLYG
jgi:hypothetical protein